MRFLIVASVLACIAAEPVPVGVAPVALAPAVPTISAGDINGAAIEAHAEASDNVRAAYDASRAAYDASRQLNDKVKELHGQAINNAQDQAWKAVDNVKTVEARLDGAAAAAAPVLAKQLVRTGQVAPLASYANPTFAASYAAPAIAAPAVASYAAPAVASYPAPAVESYANYAAPAVASYPAPAVESYANYAAPAYSPYAAPGIEYASSVVDPYYQYPVELPGFY